MYFLRLEWISTYIQKKIQKADATATIIPLDFFRDRNCHRSSKLYTEKKKILSSQRRILTHLSPTPQNKTLFK